MATRMLIDATHAEETRVAVLNGMILEEFDFETSTKAQLKGNIYLAKITRVEPSLQAAFVDYGGDRQGFLAFSEIHPDYYQIPIDDRKALLAEQAETADDERSESADSEPADSGAPSDEREANGADPDEGVETVSAEEEEEIASRSTLRSAYKKYRIQEVIKRRQILLVQVTKEERGTKGAALTTYISLAGRYCVLMPNATRGGGISRKIQSGEARKRLRAVVSALNLPEGMAVILRTAGQERTKAEIKRDYEYLLRLWDSIRELTLRSTAPTLIHEEANLIKRSVRDLYRSNMDEIQVEGEAGYRTAKDFMRMLMPSHARKVQRYRDRTTLFHKHQIESQLDAMHRDTVRLGSGGYIVINPTEALVAIDVNSGRATRERHIEETATKTNLEAADEIARQLRLRDLAGLIVIDFIDMEENRNNRAVERRLKDAVRSDRARIQMGRISAFGLLELSRQRLRPSLMEVSSALCPSCAGSGRVRSMESTALQALRAIEEEGIRGRASEIRVTMPTAAAMYLLNQKRASLNEVEQRYALVATISTDDTPRPPDCRIEQIAARPADADAGAAPEAPAQDAEATAPQPDEEATSRRRRSRRRRKRPEERTAPADVAETAPTEAPADAEAAASRPDGETSEAATEAEADEARPRSRRRGRRGGRRRSRQTETANAPKTESPDKADNMPIASGRPDAEEASGGMASREPAVAAAADSDNIAPDAAAEAVTAAKPPRPRRRRAPRKTAAKTDEGASADASAPPPPWLSRTRGKRDPDNRENLKAGIHRFHRFRRLWKKTQGPTPLLVQRWKCTGS